MLKNFIAIPNYENNNLMVFDPENELTPNKPTTFNQVIGCGFNTQGVEIHLYGNKESDTGIVRISTYPERDESQSQYVYLHDSQGKMRIDEWHFGDIVDRLDSIVLQAEPHEISTSEFAEFIFQLNGIQTEESAKDFFDKDGNWSLDVMRTKIRLFKKIQTDLMELED